MRVVHTFFHAVSSVFGCQHDHLTRLFTIGKQSYMVCLDCGHKVYYSTDKMRPMTRREVRRMRHTVVLPVTATTDIAA